MRRLLNIALAAFVLLMLSSPLWMVLLLMVFKEKLR